MQDAPSRENRRFSSDGRLPYRIIFNCYIGLFSYLMFDVFFSNVQFSRCFIGCPCSRPGLHASFAHIFPDRSMLYRLILFYKGSGSHLLSHAVSSIVPSAARVLTVVFGMGTGVSPARIATGNPLKFLLEISSAAIIPPPGILPCGFHSCFFPSRNLHNQTAYP